MPADLLASEKNSGVKPRLGVDGRNLKARVLIRSGELRLVERVGVPLFDHSETAELALWSIEVPMVISKLRHETIPADAIEVFDALDHLDWKRQLREPRSSFVF